MEGGWGLAIPKGAANPSISFQLIEYMTTKEPSQLIFDGLGLLNGSRRTLIELDLSRVPEIDWFTNTAINADRFTSTPEVQMWNECKGLLYSGIARVSCGTQDASSILKQTQKECDIIQDKFFKKIVKYKK